MNFVRSTGCAWLLLPWLNCCTPQAGDTIAFGQDPGAPKFTGQEHKGVDVTPSGNILDYNPEGFTAEENIVFTDPDSPDAAIPELSGILGDQRNQRGPWEQNIWVARKKSMREGKPTLIWFTNLRTSPRCKQLEKELFSQAKFQKWANEHLIRARVDESMEFGDRDLSLDQEQTLRIEFAKYVRKLKNHYKVLGYPSLIMVDPQGRVVGRYRGYTAGQAELTWGMLRQGVAASAASYKAWSQQLTARGYREWRDLQGRKIVAKLVRYVDGTLHLVEPDGTRSKVHERTLSATDRHWIEEQKNQQR